MLVTPSLRLMDPGRMPLLLTPNEFAPKAARRLSVGLLTLNGVGGKLGRTRRSEVPTQILQTLSSTLTAV